MRYYFRLIRTFIRASVLNETAYGANFLISLLNSLINLGTAVLGLSVLFDNIPSVKGWSFDSTLAVLGVYLTVNALRDLFISPSLDALVGMDGEVWQGRFDFTLLRPVDSQFIASVRYWKPFALIDLMFGLAVLGASMVRLSNTISLTNLAAFVLMLGAALFTLYAILLAFAALVFWSPGFLFTWVFNGIFQMARYPINLYPTGLRFILTWVIPVGIITTVPVQALTGDLGMFRLGAYLFFAITLAVGSSLLFRRGLKRYASASS